MDDSVLTSCPTSPDECPEGASCCQVDSMCRCDCDPYDDGYAMGYDCINRQPVPSRSHRGNIVPADTPSMIAVTILIFVCAMFGSWYWAWRSNRREQIEAEARRYGRHLEQEPDTTCSTWYKLWKKRYLTKHLQKIGEVVGWKCCKRRDATNSATRGQTGVHVGNEIFVVTEVHLTEPVRKNALGGNSQNGVNVGDNELRTMQLDTLV